jgi:3-methyladenine DNA glycosylase AlkC
MVSSSSGSEITKRATEFIQRQADFMKFDAAQVTAIKEYLKQEYDAIPEKERIGKGLVYIAKIVAKTLYNHIKTDVFKIAGKKPVPDPFVKSIIEFIEHAGKNEELMVLAIHLLANLASDNFETTIEPIRYWATYETWDIRENTIHPILSGLKNQKERVLRLLREWAIDPNENIRRLVAESLRPKGEIKWLRDPEKNDVVLEILSTLNHDPSIYVRKSVGNNLKDLTKYMPAKILDLIETWLAMKDNLDAKGQKNLIWTIYHALKWLKANKPEYHERIKKLVGENYLLYFDEKSNRTAAPR